ncbi:MAG: ABC transporter permease [Alkalispirochaetaceae bacterium]
MTLLKGLGELFLTVFLVATAVFLILRVLPGDPAAVIAGTDAPTERLQSIRQRLGTDEPILEQYLSWLSGVARLDFGTSFFDNAAVSSLIARRLPVTFILGGSSFVLSLLIAVPLGLLGGSRPGGPARSMVSGYEYAALALPPFLLGILLLLLFAVSLDLFPMFGTGTPLHFVLPSLSLALGNGAVLSRITRSAVVEEMEKGYVVTARAQGLTRREILFTEVLRNALTPLITVAGLQVGYLLGGAIIVESLFSLPGVGSLLVTAILNRDFPVVQGCVILIALTFVLVNRAADMLHTVADPRSRRGD